MMNKRLFIIAAGLSSRMGSYPKHLCEVYQNMTNLENTILKAKDYVDNITVVYNKLLDDKYVEQTNNIVDKYDNVDSIDIYSGYGDLDAIIQSLIYSNDREDIYCVWGDTYFDTDKIFRMVKSQDIKMWLNECIGVFCCKEENPYAFIDIDDKGRIIDSGFSDQLVGSAIKFHDQSLFRINKSVILPEYTKYRLDMDEQLRGLVSYTKVKLEYSIIKFINWMAKKSTYIDNIVYEIDTVEAQSFNTPAELKSIKINKI